MALYKREHYRPMVGMIPMLIQIPIILGLISVVYNPLQHLLHMDPQIISAFVAEATQLTGMELGSTAQLKVIELIQNPETLGAFAALQVPGADVAGAIAQIQQMDLLFFGVDFAHFPSFTHPDLYWMFPILSGLSAYLLCVFQNKENVLQKEQGFDFPHRLFHLFCVYCARGRRVLLDFGECDRHFYPIPAQLDV